MDRTEAAADPKGSVADGPKVLIVQSALADYRKHFIDELESLRCDGVELLTGLQHFDPTLRTGVSSPLVRAEANNVYIAGRRLSWQQRVIGPSIRAAQTVQEFNPRIISTWVTLVSRRLLGRPSVLWGHAWSRSGARSRSEPLRRLMRLLSDGIIVYTEAQRRELIARDVRRPVYAAPNAIYSASTMRTSASGSQTNIVWTGRMVPAKKPELALRGFIRALPDLPLDCRLCFVGTGPLVSTLESMARSASLSDRVVFLGHVSDVGGLAELYDSSVVSLSTGYLGLSLIQSLSFGVPMLYADDEPHAPEIEAANLSNSRTFCSDSPEDLAKQLIRIFAERPEWNARRETIVADCREHYSTEAMARSFLAAVAESKGNATGPVWRRIGGATSCRVRAGRS